MNLLLRTVTILMLAAICYADDFVDSLYLEAEFERS